MDFSKPHDIESMSDIISSASRLTCARRRTPRAAF